MVQHLGLFLIFGLSFSVFAQDERYYRQILNGDLPAQSRAVLEDQGQQFSINGKAYSVDLNGDGFEDYIQPQKRDGVDWIEIQDSNRRKVFEAKLLSMGSESVIYKVKLAKISDSTKLLLVYVDEGKTSGTKFESTARVFLITFDNNDFSTFQITRGPHHYHEKESQRDQYWRKNYSVDIRDVDKNGVRDVVVEFNHIQRIMLYKGKGEWTRL